eukprot:scaffold12850_cov109-Isochrysis_galbana.AAC.4
MEQYTRGCPTKPQVQSGICIWQTLNTVQVAHLTNDNYERYTREENEKALENYKCDTIEGTVIIKGVRYVTSEILDSFEEICDAIHPQRMAITPNVKGAPR